MAIFCKPCYRADLERITSRAGFVLPLAQIDDVPEQTVRCHLDIGGVR